MSGSEQRQGSSHKYAAQNGPVIRPEGQLLSNGNEPHDEENYAGQLPPKQVAPKVVVYEHKSSVASCAPECDPPAGEWPPLQNCNLCVEAQCGCYVFIGTMNRAILGRYLCTNWKRVPKTISSFELRLNSAKH
jgi:hypothetical protein